MRKFFLSSVAFLCLSATASIAEINYSNVINLSGKQRMLTQKMSKEAMLVTLGVDKANNLTNLKKTHDLFAKTLTGLRNGDDSLGLPPTKKPKILKALGKVDGLWAEFSPSINSIISNGTADDAQVSTLASKNIPLLKAMNRTVKMYESAATNGDMNEALAIAINLSGRQRMLTQKMSKEFLLVAKGHETDVNTTNLDKTVALFDKTLNGLIDGDAGLGLSPAPTEEIAGQLNKVKSLWTSFKEHITGGQTPENIQAVAKQNIPLLKEMNKAVGMFAALGE